MFIVCTDGTGCLKVTGVNALVVDLGVPTARAAASASATGRIAMIAGVILGVMPMDSESGQCKLFCGCCNIYCRYQ